MKAETLLAYGFGLVLAYVVVRLLSVPLRFLARFAYGAAVGSLLLMLGNVFAGLVGLKVGLNPVTVATVGLLGVPGVVMLYVLRFILGAG